MRGVGGLPDEIADALEAEHRIEGVEGHRRGGVGGVRRAGGDEACRRPGLGDPLLEDLASLRLGVAEQQVVVDRLVQLALRGVDLQLREQRVHAERAPFVGDDRDDVLAEVGVACEVAQQSGEAHRRRHGLPAGALAQLGERRCRRGARPACGSARPAWAASRRAPAAAPSCTGTRSSPGTGGSTVRSRRRAPTRGSRRGGTAGRAGAAAAPCSSS